MNMTAQELHFRLGEIISGGDGHLKVAINYDEFGDGDLSQREADEIDIEAESYSSGSELGKKYLLIH
jgi:hypothetical protein